MKKKRFWEHGAWNAIGVLVAITIALSGWFIFDKQEPSNPPPTPGPSVDTPDSPSSSSPPTSPDPTSSVSGMFLSDLDEKRFIKQPYRNFRGMAQVDGLEYASSYFFKFENCSECIVDSELNVPVGYQKLKGTIGLTDESRHDDVIDGIAYFSIYSTNGELLLPPQRIEYPESKPFEVVLKDSTRIRLSVSGGTNFEFPCWCNAQFVK
jgi:hypothetical protein